MKSFANTVLADKLEDALRRTHAEFPSTPPKRAKKPKGRPRTGRVLTRTVSAAVDIETAQLADRLRKLGVNVSSVVRDAVIPELEQRLKMEEQIAVTDGRLKGVDHGSRW